MSGSFVSDAARRVFIDLFPGRFEEVENLAGEYSIASVREASSEARHAAQPYGHQPRSHLGNREYRRECNRDYKIDFVAGVLPGITFFFGSESTARMRM